MENGTRKSSTIPLSDAGKAHLWKEIRAIRTDEDVFVFRDYIWTGYSDKRNKAHISFNAFSSMDDSNDFIRRVVYGY